MTKKIILVALFVALAAIVVFSSGIIAADKKTEKSITWYTDFDKAAAAAKKQAKPIMVDFYTDWCGWCKKLDNDTYTNSDVITASRKFICVKVDGDKKKDLVKKYSVNGYPTIVFLNSKSQEISRVVGYRGPSDFLKAMNDALKGKK